MGKVSKNKMKEEVADLIWENILRLVVSIKNKREAEVLLRDVLTPTEQVMIAKRVAIATLLLSGAEYREISQKLKVSSSTINSVSLKLKNQGQAYEVIAEKINKDEQFQEILEMMLSLVVKANPMPPYGRGRWRGLRE